MNSAVPARSSMRRKVAIVVVLAVLLLGVAVRVAVVGPGPLRFSEGELVPLVSYRGTDPTGVPRALRDASLVTRGEYLARAADCMACHTAVDGAAFAGGLALHLPFGYLYSTNITPDMRTGIGAYTDDQFLAAVRRGIRADGTRLYPAMPFTSYRLMTDADVLAIKAYLFSLKPVTAAPPRNRLSRLVDQRWTLGAWSALLSPDERFTPDQLRSAEWNRGAYVAEALAHCGECHTPRTIALSLDNRKKFAGALTAGWRAYNITSDPATGIGSWDEKAITGYLSTGHAEGHGSAAGPMGEAVSASFRHLDPADLHALVVYLRSVPAIRSADLPAITVAVASPSHRDTRGPANPRGKAFYEGACAACHGWTGESPFAAYATLTGARAVNDASGINVAEVVLGGARRSSPDETPMPAFGRAYSDEDIAAVVNYVTARFGAVPSTIAAKDVARLRGESGG